MLIKNIINKITNWGKKLFSKTYRKEANDVNKDFIFFAIENNIITKDDLKSYIVLSLWTKHLKEEKESEYWSFSNLKFGKLYNGFWEIKDGKRYIYYKDSCITLNKSQERFIDDLVYKFIKSLKTKYTYDIKYIYSIECSSKIHINVLTNIPFDYRLRSVVRSIWCKKLNEKEDLALTYTKKLWWLEESKPEEIIDYVTKGYLKLSVSINLKNKISESKKNVK